MRFHYLRPVTAYSRVIFAQISGDFEDGVAVSSYEALSGLVNLRSSCNT